MADALERFLSFVRRELSAEDVAVVGGDDPPDDRLRATLPDGRFVAVRFSSPPKDLDATQRRLEMLASTFADTLPSEPPPKAARPTVAGALRKELDALRERAGARAAAVIDAHSPVVWGATEPTANDGPISSAIDDVRTRPEIELLGRGRAFHHTHHADTFGYLARSLGGIYVLILVFEREFDELRAERAVIEARERIERLIAALPPLDPTPEPRAAVVRMRRRR